jgi:hypothetical protein
MTEPAGGDARTGGDARPEDAVATDAQAPAAGGRFADLENRPVAEHVGVFEAEHDRLQRELGTIDQL